MRPATQLGGWRAWSVWLLSVSFVVWIYLGQTGYAVFNPYLQRDLALTLEQVAFIGALYPCLAAVIQIFSGALMDNLGPRKTMIPAIMLITLSVLCMAKATSFYHLVLSQVLCASGACFGFAGAGYLTSKWFPPHRFGLVFGMVQVVVSTFTAFGQLFMNELTQRFPLTHILLGLASLGLVFALLHTLFLRLPEPMPTKPFHPMALCKEILSDCRYVLGNRDIWMSCIYGGIVYGFIWALGVVWMPKLIAAHGIDQSSANQSSTFLWLGVAVGSLVLDWIWRKLRHTKATLLLFLLAQAGTLWGLFYLSLTPTTAKVLCFLFGLATSSHMMVYSLGKQSIPPRYSGSAISIVNSAMFLLGGIFVAILGKLLDGTSQQLQDYQEVSWIFWVAMVLVGVSVFFFRSTPPLQASDENK